MGKKIEIEMVLERETKNTIRYGEVVSDEPLRIGTMYIQKWAGRQLNSGEYPRKVRVIIEPLPS